jgi:DNA processing protein
LKPIPTPSRRGYLIAAIFGYAPCMAGRISDETKLDWLRLIRSDHIGPHTFRALLARYGGARAALDALPDLARRGGASGPPRIYSRENAERELAAMATLGVGLLATAEADYPQRLAMIDDAPPLLAVRGIWRRWHYP